MNQYIDKTGVFADFNFKLVVIEALLQEEPSFLEPLEKLVESYSDDYEWYSDMPPIEEVAIFLSQLQLTTDQLESINELCFDGGNEIYFMLKPDWDGEDSIFDITSVEGFTKLKNLKEVEVTSMVEQDVLVPMKNAGIDIDCDYWVETQNLKDIYCKEIQNISQYFNPGAEEKDFRRIEEKWDITLPEDFKDLYRHHDGEAKYLGSILNYELMPLKRVYQEYKDLIEEWIAIRRNTKDILYIKEVGSANAWVPFATDNSGSFILIDLEPDELGYIGQVIAYDQDTEETILLARSISHLLKKLEFGLNVKNIIVADDDGEEYLMARELEVFAERSKQVIPKDRAIEVDPYYREYFNVKGTTISTQQLWTVEEIDINDKDNKYGEISLEILKYMPNLRRIVFFTDATDLHHMTRLEYLEGMAFIDMDLSQEKWNILKEITKIKELSIYRSFISDLNLFLGNKDLKKLRLSTVSFHVLNDLNQFQKLEELNLEIIGLMNPLCFEGLSKLRKLKCHSNVTILNLEFLQYLPNLEEFSVEAPAMDESCISTVKELTKLQYLNYPIRDLSLIAGLEKLKEVTVNAADYYNVRSLKDSSIRSVMLYGARDDEHVEEVIDEIQQYKSLTSYAWS